MMTSAEKQALRKAWHTYLGSVAQAERLRGYAKRTRPMQEDLHRHLADARNARREIDEMLAESPAGQNPPQGETP